MPLTIRCRRVCSIFHLLFCCFCIAFGSHLEKFVVLRNWYIIFTLLSNVFSLHVQCIHNAKAPIFGLFDQLSLNCLRLTTYGISFWFCFALHTVYTFRKYFIADFLLHVACASFWWLYIVGGLDYTAFFWMHCNAPSVQLAENLLFCSCITCGSDPTELTSVGINLYLADTLQIPFSTVLHCILHNCFSS